MRETGGPTTQSGMYFQNTVAAWFMARMLRDAIRGVSENRVVRVRCEAPEEVDDVVVTFERGVHYVQVKETLAASGAAWTELWRHFWKQLDRIDSEHDRLILWGGRHIDLFGSLQAMIERAQSVPPGPHRRQVDEFLGRLTQKQLGWLESIAAIIRDYMAETVPDQEPVEITPSDLFDLLRVTDVEVKGSAQEIEELAVHTFLSGMSDAQAVFALLRDQAAEKARTRGSWDDEGLRAALATRGVQLRPGAPGMPGDDVASQAEWEALERLLKIHKRNLRKLREQEAMYGAGAAPLHLLNQIEHEEEAIRNIERKLGR